MMPIGSFLGESDPFFAAAETVADGHEHKIPAFSEPEPETPTIPGPEPEEISKPVNITAEMLTPQRDKRPEAPKRSSEPKSPQNAPKRSDTQPIPVVPSEKQRRHYGLLLAAAGCTAIALIAPSQFRGSENEDIRAEQSDVAAPTETQDPGSILVPGSESIFSDAIPQTPVTPSVSPTTESSPSATSPAAPLIAYNNPGKITLGGENGCVESTVVAKNLSTDDLPLKTVVKADEGRIGNFWTSITDASFDQVACAPNGLTITDIQPVREPDGSIKQHVTVDVVTDVVVGARISEGSTTPEIFSQRDMLAQSGVSEPCVLAKTTTGCEGGPEIDSTAENIIITTARIIAAQALQSCSDESSTTFRKAVRQAVKKKLREQGDDAVAVEFTKVEYPFMKDLISNLADSGGFDDRSQQETMFKNLNTNPELTCTAS